MYTPTVEALLDIDQIAEAVGLPADATRVLLDMHEQRQAATYRGKPLWLRDALDAVLAEHTGQVAP